MATLRCAAGCGTSIAHRTPDGSAVVVRLVSPLGDDRFPLVCCSTACADRLRAR